MLELCQFRNHFKHAGKWILELKRSRTEKRKSACTIRVIVNLCTHTQKKRNLSFPTSTYGKTPSSGTKLISQVNSRANKDTHQTPTGQCWANSLHTSLLAGHSRHPLSYFLNFPNKKKPRLALPQLQPARRVSWEDRSM